jgi:hypothetical protein
MTLKTVERAQVEEVFRRLRQQWKDDCSYLSSTTAMIRHPAYQAIIDLGQPVVPFLLRDLELGPVHWFEALKSITGEDPVPRDDWGNIPAMASAWLAWGRSRNLV